MNPKELKKPNVSEDLAIDLALRYYGMTVISIKRMVSFDDQNFHIQVSSDHQNQCLSEIHDAGYTLKITNTMKSALPGHFDSMHRAMIHLHNKGLRVPLPVPNTDGKTWRLEKVPLLNENDHESDEPDRCGIHLLTYITGQPVSTVTSTASLLYQWGSLLAQFHNGTEDFASPYLMTKDIFWDLEHVPEIRSFMSGLDEDKKSLVTEVLDEYPEQIDKNLPNLRKGFIHGDFNENNILCQISEKSENEQEYTVDGILDFEDMQYGTYAWDVGVMLAYTLLDCKLLDPLEGAGHALAGYLKYRSLDELDLSVLKMCTALRLCQSLVLGAYSYSLDTSNTYLIISARTGWDRLRQIWSTKNEDLLAIWKNIRDQYNARS